MSTAATRAAASVAAPRARILAVDDHPEGRRALQRVLTAAGYQVEVARDGFDALAKLPLGADLVLMDAEMPGLDGFEVTRRIRSDPAQRDLPILMVTGMDSPEDRARAAEAGVTDFITKPYEVAELQARCAALLRAAQVPARAAPRTNERAVAERSTELLREIEAARAAHLDAVRRFALAAEARDSTTPANPERLGLYCALLATALGQPPDEAELTRHAAPLHDIGKIGIPDAILLSPRKLDTDEWEIVKRHTTIGARMLRGSPSPVLQAGEVIALSHHERWDGSGYPHGLRADAIPLLGRICAVADVFDALTCHRLYRDAVPTQLVWEMMLAERARHFDPVVLDAFVRCRDAVKDILRRPEGGVRHAPAPGAPAAH